MVLSKRCEYALRSVLYLSAPEREAFTAVREVSGALGIPYPFLAKLVQTLAQAGLLQTLRGKNGGIALARPAASMTLKEVVLTVDGPRLFQTCVLRLPDCNDAQPCPLHAEWAALRTRIERMFERATLATVAEATRTHRFRLSSFALDADG